MKYRRLHFCASLGTLALCKMAAEQEGSASAVSVVEELALPLWSHRVSLTDVRPTADVQDRAAEVPRCYPLVTLLFLLTLELPKQFPLR